MPHQKPEHPRVPIRTEDVCPSCGYESTEELQVPLVFVVKDGVTVPIACGRCHDGDLSSLRDGDAQIIT